MHHPLLPTDAPISEDEARACFVDEMPRLEGRIEVAEYDPAWPAQFECEAATIRSALGEQVLELEHVGSTSVPGLAAKPILDIDLTLRDSTCESEYVPALEAAGYRLTIREPHWHEHRMLKRCDPVVHLHVWTVGSPEAARHRIFRDWLRSNKTDRRLYGAHKQAIAEQEFEYMREYNNAKAEVLRAILGRALDALPTT